jgi:hypothetical protein
VSVLLVGRAAVLDAVVVIDRVVVIGPVIVLDGLPRCDAGGGSPHPSSLS